MKILLEELDLPELKPIVDVSKVKIVQKSKLGRPDDAKNISDLTKKLIAIDSVGSSLSQSEIASIHGVTQATVSHLSQGFNGTNLETRKEKPEIKTLIDNKKDEIVGKANKKLLECLDWFEPQALKQREIPAAASSMAKVVRDLSTKEEEGKKDGPRFIIFAPRVRSEDAYDIITVSE